MARRQIAYSEKRRIIRGIISKLKEYKATPGSEDYYGDKILRYVWRAFLEPKDARAYFKRKRAKLRSPLEKAKDLKRTPALRELAKQPKAQELDMFYFLKEKEKPLAPFSNTVYSIIQAADEEGVSRRDLLALLPDYIESNNYRAAVGDATRRLKKYGLIKVEKNHQKMGAIRTETTEEEANARSD